MGESQPAADWDRYWRGTWEAAAHEDGSPQEVALEQFWRKLLTSLPSPADGLSLLDMAAGNGAVLRYAYNTIERGLQAFALDYSLSALLNLRQRYPDVHCLAADALRPPLAPASFDAVVSQYGLEYAGADAISAAGQLVCEGGYLALVVHYREGAIYQECDTNLRALLDIKSLNVVELARIAFAAGFALNAGRGSVDSFKSAERAFTPAVRGLEQLRRRYGDQAAGGLLKQLYKDIASMYPRMSQYDEQEVLTWLDGMGPELDAYIGRMKSMTDAAVDAPSLDEQCKRLYASGFHNIQRKELRIRADSSPAAWTLVARRDSLA